MDPQERMLLRHAKLIHCAGQNWSQTIRCAVLCNYSKTTAAVPEEREFLGQETWVRTLIDVFCCPSLARINHIARRMLVSSRRLAICRDCLAPVLVSNLRAFTGRLEC